MLEKLVHLLPHFHKLTKKSESRAAYNHQQHGTKHSSTSLTEHNTTEHYAVKHCWGAPQSQLLNIPLDCFNNRSSPGVFWDTSFIYSVEHTQCYYQWILQAALLAGTQLLLPLLQSYQKPRTQILMVDVVLWACLVDVGQICLVSHWNVLFWAVLREGRRIGGESNLNDDKLYSL